MPSVILSPIKIITISDGGTVNFGDTLQIAPKNTSKAATGAGGGGSGDFQAVYILNSITNVADPDVADTNTTSVT